MGYTTEFRGSFSFNKEVDAEMVQFINRFAYYRHMRRDTEKIKKIFPNWQELCFKGDLGKDGEYFIGGGGFKGQDHDESILDYNSPGGGCPDLWCQWIIKDGTLSWDGGEKFSYYIEWLQYLIDRFFKPEGYILSGEVEYQGENPCDHGFIYVEDNHIEVEKTPPVILERASNKELLNECLRRNNWNFSRIQMKLDEISKETISVTFTIPKELLNL